MAEFPKNYDAATLQANTLICVKSPFSKMSNDIDDETTERTCLGKQ